MLFGGLTNFWGVLHKFVVPGTAYATWIHPVEKSSTTTSSLPMCFSTPGRWGLRAEILKMLVIHPWDSVVFLMAYWWRFLTNKRLLRNYLANIDNIGNKGGPESHTTSWHFFLLWIFVCHCFTRQPQSLRTWKLTSIKECLHLWKLTWNLKIIQLNREIIFQTCIFGFYVNFPGCIQNLFELPGRHFATRGEDWWLWAFQNGWPEPGIPSSCAEK